MLVEVDAFSGRPNPAWTLDPGEQRELRKRLERLPRTHDVEIRVPGLGYRGMVVTPGPKDDADFEAVRVCEGRVLVEPDGATCLDEGRALETWLFATGAAHMAPDERVQLAHALGLPHHE